MAGVSASGAGGLDVAGIVSQLMKAESRSMIPLTKQASSFQSLMSAYGTLKSSVSTFQSALNDLSNVTFSAQKMQVTNTGSGTTTDPFSAAINVDTATKALPQIIQSETIAAGTTFRSGDSIAIQVGKEPPKFVTLSSDQTLQQLVQTINDAKTGATASIVKDADGEHLALESNASGSGNTMKVFANGSLSAFGYNTSNTSPTTMKQTQAPRDVTVAAAGVHDISITQLAQAHKLKTPGFDADTTFGSGLLAIKTGTGTTTLISPKSPTLAGVRDAINASDAGVTASIVNDGNKSHLVISSKESGANNAIKITGTESFAAFNYDPASQNAIPQQTASIATGTTFDAGSGAFSVKVGNTVTNFKLTGTNQSLADIRAQINSSNIGVTASVVDEGGNSRLVFTPTTPGAPVSLTGTGDFAALNNTATSTGMTQMSPAQDARVVIDGIVVTSHTNEVKDAISGITLTLNKTTTANDEFKLDVSNDKSSVQSAISTFVDSYNALMKTLTSMTAYDADKKVAGALQGDSGARSIVEQLRSVMASVVEGNDGMSTLSSIGISMQKDGTFKTDAVKLNKAATDNFAGLSRLLTSDDGIITKLKTLTKDFLGDSGIITERTNSIQKSIDLNTKRQEDMQLRLSEIEDRYTKKYNALDLALAKMQTMQSQLTAQLATLPR